jgi:hypothetical protein
MYTKFLQRLFRRLWTPPVLATCSQQVSCAGSLKAKTSPAVLVLVQSLQPK